MKKKPLHKAYAAIEDTMIAAVRAMVTPRAEKLISDVRDVLARDDFNSARRMVEVFTLRPAIDAQIPKLKELGVSAMLFGASRHKPVSEVSHVVSRQVPYFVDQAITQLCTGIEYGVTLRIKAAALLIISDAEDSADRERKAAALLKHNPYHDEKGRFTTAEDAVTLSGPLKEDDADQYHYHATSIENALGIAESGSMVPHEPSFGTDQDVWPDGAVEERSYFGKPDNIWMFAPEEGRAVSLRVKRGKKFKEESGTGDMYTTKPIPAEDIEIKTKDGWKPLKASLIKSELQSSAVKKIDMTAEEIGAALSRAVMAGTVMRADVMSNVTTSRLASYGFLVEAQKDGIEAYKISAILDDRTCPVCVEMDGVVFDMGVSPALSRLEQSLHTDDPEDLKVLAPWPSQSQDSIKELQRASMEDLQIMGYDAPPFHPYCRCILVAVDDQELAELPPTPTPANDNIVELPEEEREIIPTRVPMNDN